MYVYSPSTQKRMLSIPLLLHEITPVNVKMKMKI